MLSFTYFSAFAHGFTYVRIAKKKLTESWVFFFIFEDFRPISGSFPAFYLSRIFSFLTDTFISFFPEHFEWLTGAVPQFVAVLQKHKLNLVLKSIDNALG